RSELFGKQNNTALYLLLIKNNNSQTKNKPIFMKIKFLLLPAMSLFLMFASCKKDSGSNNNPNPNPPPSTPTVDANESLNNKLTANSWTLTSFTANGMEQIGSTYSSVTGTFQKEDKNNGSYSFMMINMNGTTTPDNGKYLIR